MTNTLPPARVREIRQRLDLSRADFADLIDVSVATVRAWEETGNPRGCSGPARLLLLLLERAPDILAQLNTWSIPLPVPPVGVGTEAWFRLQRLLGLVGSSAPDPEYWRDLRQEEGITDDWLQRLEDHGLATPSPEDGTLWVTTSKATKAFALDVWARWVDESFPDADASTIPLMTSEIFLQLTKPRHR